MFAVKVHLTLTKFALKVHIARTKICSKSTLSTDKRLQYRVHLARTNVCSKSTLSTEKICPNVQTKFVGNVKYIIIAKTKVIVLLSNMDDFQDYISFKIKYCKT